MAGRSSVETLEKLGHTHHRRSGLHGSKDTGTASEEPWQETLGICQRDRSFGGGKRKAEAKGIGNSTTLPRDARTQEEAEAVLEDLAGSVGRRLRKAGQKAGMLSVEIKYHTFESVSHQRQSGEADESGPGDLPGGEGPLSGVMESGAIRLLGIKKFETNRGGRAGAGQHI